MWPFKKDKNMTLRNCLNMYKQNFIEIQDVAVDQDISDRVKVSEIRFQLARSLTTINKILENLK